MFKSISSIFAIIITFSLFSCNTTETRKETKTSNTTSVTKTDSVPETKPDSVVKIEDTATQKPAAKELPDSVAFHKVLTFKNLTFEVNATGKGSLQKVTIQPSGLTVTNRQEILETEPVINAEIADLNADGYPEVLLFTQSAGSGSYGKVVAFSVNAGKSMSRVTFPETSQNAELKKGYQGHDKFAVINQTLTQEFPVYNESDANSKVTGIKKVVTYKLKNGEASRVFVVDQVKVVSQK